MSYLDWQYIIWNFKNTRWNTREGNGNVKEIIEVGAVKLDQSLNLMSTYHSYVRPLMSPILSEYCIKTNNISQEQVDNSPTFTKMLDEFMPWVGIGRIKTISWGTREKQNFKYNCQMYGRPYKWISKNIDLKKKYGIIRDIEKPTFTNALNDLNIPFNIDQTSSLDIAWRTTDIMLLLKEDMDFLKKVW